MILITCVISMVVGLDWFTDTAINGDFNWSK